MKTAIPVKNVSDRFRGNATMYWLSEPVIVEYEGQKDCETPYVIASAVDLARFYEGTGIESEEVVVFASNAEGFAGPPVAHLRGGMDHGPALFLAGGFVVV